MKALLVANTSWYLFNFRLPLGRVLRAHGWEVVLVSPADDYSTRFQEEGFRWIHVPLSGRGLNPFYELRTVLALTSLYRREQPDVVHHFTVKCVLYGTLAAKMIGVQRIVNAITGLGYIFTSRSLKATALRGLLQLIYRPILKNTDVVFQNADDYDAFLEHGWIKPAQAHIVPGSGVDVDNFRPSAEPPGVVTVLLPARMLWAKGVGEFVSAARILIAEKVPARFLLVGDADQASADSVPLNIIESWQAEGVVEWLGWEPDMPAAYGKAHIVCLPSYYGEGVPRVLVEAAASGRPIVTTDMPGCRDVVHANVNGLLVPARDIGALVSALKTLIMDRDLRVRMGKEGRRIAIDGFSASVIVEKTRALFYA